MRLEARPCLGVLLLPLLALLLVTFEPLAGLGVEAVGVDVIALLVVGGGMPYSVGSKSSPTASRPGGTGERRGRLGRPVD
jgi:hypothetical protein